MKRRKTKISVVRKEDGSMNISTYGDELMKKQLDSFKDEIKAKYSDDEEEQEFRLMKVEELRLFIAAIWTEMSKGFLLESPWFNITDTGENVTILVKSFTDKEDMQPYSFKDAPDTAVLVEVDTEHYCITFRIGLERCAEITILGSNAVNFVCSDDEFDDKPIYHKLLSIISAAQIKYSNAPDPSEKKNSKAEIVSGKIVAMIDEFIKSGEDDEKYRRMAFARTIAKLEETLPDCVDGGWSDWFDLNKSSDGPHFYSKLWLNEEDAHYLEEGFDTKDTPPNIISVIFLMDELVIDVSIGTNGLVRFTFDENGAINPIFNSKFDNPMYDAVYDTVMDIIKESE